MIIFWMHMGSMGNEGEETISAGGSSIVTFIAGGRVLWDRIVSPKNSDGNAEKNSRPVRRKSRKSQRFAVNCDTTNEPEKEIKREEQL